MVAILRRWLWLLLLPGLLACEQAVLPAEDDVLARQAIADLQVGNVDRFVGVVLPDIVEPLRRGFDQLRAGIPGDANISPELESFAVLTYPPPNARRVTNLLYTLHGLNRAAWVRIAVLNEGGTSKLGTIYIGDLAKAEETNAFALQARTPAHYLMLVLMGVCVLISLTAMVLAIRTKGLPWRWAWAAGSLVSVMQLAINWTTGEIGFQLFTVSLFGAAAVQAPLSPWILSASLPLVAIIFLMFGPYFVRRAP